MYIEFRKTADNDVERRVNVDISDVVELITDGFVTTMGKGTAYPSISYEEAVGIYPWLKSIRVEYHCKNCGKWTYDQFCEECCEEYRNIETLHGEYGYVTIYNFNTGVYTVGKYAGEEIWEFVEISPNGSFGIREKSILSYVQNKYVEVIGHKSLGGAMKTALKIPKRWGIGEDFDEEDYEESFYDSTSSHSEPIIVGECYETFETYQRRHFDE